MGKSLLFVPKLGSPWQWVAYQEGHAAGFMLGKKNKMKAEELVYEAVPGLTPNWSWPESSGPT